MCNNCKRIEHLACIYMGMGCSTHTVERCEKCIRVSMKAPTVTISARDLPAGDFEATKMVFESVIHDYANIKIVQ